ncbi:MAG: 2-phospho-L-lactate transferase [Mycobacterium sp.]|nr:2-phospho-L-lactate transferase [Mycobacterium sp.]
MFVHVKVTVLVGGVGGARFLIGVQRLLGLGRFSGQSTTSQFSGGSQSDNELTAIVNIGDDAWMYGVRICPDLDTCMYTLGDGIDAERGWGRRNETWHAKEELAAYGVQPDWFGLGDRDLATHLVRSQMLRAGYPLSQVTQALCDRWKPGARLLPASDDRSETHVVITDPGPGDQAGEKRAIHFEEWWVRYRAQVPTHSFAFVGAEAATAGPGVTEAIETADVVLLAPSNPVVSIGAIMAVPGIRGALRSTSARVVGYSPIIAGKPLRGMADECLSVIGVASTSEAVGGHYGARSGVGILDGWLVHEGDHAEIDGVEVRSVPLLMTDPETTAEMVRAGLDLAGVKP